MSSSQIHVSVEDTGLGISSSNLEKLFKAFGKITNAADSALNSQGVGLGLVISNKLALILNDMEEGIKVESILHKGSKFSFTFIDRFPEDQITISSHRISPFPKQCYELKLIEKCKGLSKYDAQSDENFSRFSSSEINLAETTQEKNSIHPPESSKKHETIPLSSRSSFSRIIRKLQKF